MNVDVAVIGGGGAALWLAVLARRRGHSVALIAAPPVGGEQTMASQGIIHGGSKYALGNPFAGRGGASSVFPQMPARWRRCLRGQADRATGDLDLRRVRMLAEDMTVHASAAAVPRLYIASRLIAHRSYTPKAIEVEDFVIDVPSLVDSLLDGMRDCLIPRHVHADMLVTGAGGIEAIDLGDRTIRARCYVLAAGAGNVPLLPRVGLGPELMVRRPLHQVFARTERRKGLYAHFLTRPFGTEPDLTVTSHDDEGDTVYYLGGRLATDGAWRDEDAQIHAARRVLATALPHDDAGRPRIRTLRVDRAEPAHRQPGLAADAFLARRGNALLALPVKLTLLPRLGDLFLGQLTDLAPDGRGGSFESRNPIQVARRPWQDDTDPAC